MRRSFSASTMVANRCNAATESVSGPSSQPPPNASAASPRTAAPATAINAAASNPSRSTTEPEPAAHPEPEPIPHLPAMQLNRTCVRLCHSTEPKPVNSTDPTQDFLAVVMRRLPAKGVLRNAAIPAAWRTSPAEAATTGARDGWLQGRRLPVGTVYHARHRWYRLSQAYVHSLSTTLLVSIVIDPAMQRGAMVPECDIPDTPAPPDDELGLQLLPEEQLQQGITFILGDALDRRRMERAKPVVLESSLGDDPNQRMLMRTEGFPYLGDIIGSQGRAGFLAVPLGQGRVVQAVIRMTVDRGQRVDQIPDWLTQRCIARYQARPHGIAAHIGKLQHLQHCKRRLHFVIHVVAVEVRDDGQVREALPASSYVGLVGSVDEVPEGALLFSSQILLWEEDDLVLKDSIAKKLNNTIVNRFFRVNAEHRGTQLRALGNDANLTQFIAHAVSPSLMLYGKDPSAAHRCSHAR